MNIETAQSVCGLGVASMLLSHVCMTPERNQLPTASIAMYMAVGPRDLGNILKRYGSRTASI